MKQVICLLVVLSSVLIQAQEKPVQIVFDVTSGDESTHKAAVRHVKFMSQAYTDSKFEVVMYSNSVNMALAEKSVVAAEITDLIQNENVSFKVCAGTMKRMEKSAEDLIEGVEIVPDGILEIVMRQQEGWSYIKEAHH